MTYSIQEVSKLTGLPSSTLRYYESVGIIAPIERDPNSKHRVYSESNLENIYSVACLYAANIPMKGIKKYFTNMSHGESGVDDQIDLFESHINTLEKEIDIMKIRKKYVQIKLKYWKAVKAKSETQVKETLEELKKVSKKLIIKNS